MLHLCCCNTYILLLAHLREDWTHLFVCYVKIAMSTNMSLLLLQAAAADAAAADAAASDAAAADAAATKAAIMFVETTICRGGQKFCAVKRKTAYGTQQLPPNTRLYTESAVREIVKEALRLCRRDVLTCAHRAAGIDTKHDIM